MSIQANINQMLSVASVLASMNPTLRAKKETGSRVKNLTSQRDVLNKGIDVARSEGKINLAESLAEEASDVSRELFKTDPTEENLKKFSSYETTPLMTVEADPEEIAQERFAAEQKELEVNSYLEQYRKQSQEAENALIAKQEEKRASRPKFNEVFDRSLEAEGFDPKLIPADVKKELKGQLTHSEKIKMRKEFGNG